VQGNNPAGEVREESKPWSEAESNQGATKVSTFKLSSSSGDGDAGMCGVGGTILWRHQVAPLRGWKWLKIARLVIKR
jgi:hypothetical protein